MLILPTCTDAPGSDATAYETEITALSVIRQRNADSDDKTGTADSKTNTIPLTIAAEANKDTRIFAAS